VPNQETELRCLQFHFSCCLGNFFSAFAVWRTCCRGWSPGFDYSFCRCATEPVYLFYCSPRLCCSFV